MLRKIRYIWHQTRTCWRTRMVLIDTAEKLQCNWPTDGMTCLAHGVNLNFERKTRRVLLCLASKLCDICWSSYNYSSSLIFSSWLTSHWLKFRILLNWLLIRISKEQTFSHVTAKKRMEFNLPKTFFTRTACTPA